MNHPSENRLNVAAEEGDINELKKAAEEGDISKLYVLITKNPHILENIDSIPFVDTPLHFAASVDPPLQDAASVKKLQFATEIMRLKPSFAWKQNPGGLTPIHLALKNNNKAMVLRFVDINKDLIRIKGREGLTPLHSVIELEDIDLLLHFLSLCPDSIGDVNDKRETALHIALKNEQLGSLQVLIGCLRRSYQKNSELLEITTLNCKDEGGNTILHASVIQKNLEMVKLLVKTKVDLNAKNGDNLTALDIADNNTEIKNVLESAGAKHGSSVTNIPTVADLLKSKMTLMDRISTSILRIKSDITEDQRNAYLIVATLVTTATYQSILSPPGGLYQANAGDDNANTTSLNSTANATQWLTGKSVLPASSFLTISFLNTFSFVVSIMAIFILTPAGMVPPIVLVPIHWFAFSYLSSMMVISPSEDMKIVTIIMFLLLFIPIMSHLASERANKRPLGRYSAGGNRWWI